MKKANLQRIKFSTSWLREILVKVKSTFQKKIHKKKCQTPNSFIKHFINLFQCDYSLLIAEYFAAKIVKIGLVNKMFMVCCMTCPWAPMTGETTAQSGQRNDGVKAPKTQRLHQRLGHINRTLYAHIEKPTSLEKTLIIYTK